jgi:hypothetical protein
MEPDLMVLKRNRFMQGMLLAWAPLAFFFFGLINAFRGIGQSKATGLGAVAGGFAQYYLIFGMVSAVAFQLIAIVLLSRSLSHEKRARKALALLTILFCGASLLVSIAGIYMTLNMTYTARP